MLTRAALTFILDNTWLTRIWTAQEIILASNPVVRCGEATLDWMPFFALSLHSAHHLGEWAFGLSRIRARATGRYFHQYAFRNTPQKANLREIDYSRRRWSSVQFLIRNNYCIDPKDKIYGIYSLLPFPHEALPPVDYSKSPMELYEDFTKAIMRYTGSIDFLFNWEGQKRLPGLPTWVPDFSMTERTRKPSEPTGRTPLAATRGSVIDTALLDEAGRGHLLLKCHQLGSVDQSAMRWDGELKDKSRVDIAHWLHLVFFAMQSSHKPKSTVSILQELLTLGDAAYLSDQWAADKKDLGDSLAVALARHETDGKRNNALTVIHRIASPFVAGFTLFTIGNAHVGVCSESVGRNDVVALVAGCSSPLVIHPQGNKFSLVGHAYVCGIMKGEAWTQQVVEESLATIIMI